MNTFDAMLQRRSIRKFRPERISCACLERIVEISRLYPSGGNLQPIRFAVIASKELTDALFADLRWAMYLPDYEIAPDERPTAYVILLRDENVSKKCDYDVGAASTMVMLASVEEGLASCPIGNFHKDKLRAMLNLPAELHPELVIALGYPAQESHVVPMKDTIRYSQNANGDFLVPKWNAEDVLIFTDAQ